ncbi:transmembrane bax inhibitor motif-containing protein-like protein 4 [Erysiphe pulchra]|uniref:Transmembrane bax inhibitor motif-containing protein-like protein 4 n=1 Tax=Erysiphe pulchra TaxID=225359 RepID=A0A2S4PLQ1_9PEZI|nr:transmembrane bax inhibitor motif-containing protein-like protein 4 [Erysiphe pulchra]
MAPTTKYSVAPQRDSLDDTHAPPAYSDRPTASTDEAALFQGPRNSEDELPDDFKYGGSVAEATIDIRMAFVRKVYAILTVQLIATSILSGISFFSASFKYWIQSNQWMVWISLIGSIGFMLLTYWKRKSYPSNLIFLGGFTAFEAYSVAVITSFYESRIVLQAVALTAAIFIALTIFACQSKYDFTSWIPYLFGGLCGLMVFGLFAAFFPGNTTDLIYSGLAALIFSAYILVDTQLIMRHYHVEEEIAAAISLYLDIINLFLAILRILNSQENR